MHFANQKRTFSVAATFLKLSLKFLCSKLMQGLTDGSGLAVTLACSTRMHIVFCSLWHFLCHKLEAFQWKLSLILFCRHHVCYIHSPCGSTVRLLSCCQRSSISQRDNMHCAEINASSTYMLITSALHRLGMLTLCSVHCSILCAMISWQICGTSAKYYRTLKAFYQIWALRINKHHL